MNRGSTTTPAPAAAIHGFTLIELLVVISIVALLTGVLLPALASGRDAAKNTQCLAQMRQVGLAVTLYCEEHDGDFPETTHTAGPMFTRSWLYRIGQYTHDVDAVRVCPEDPKREERLTSSTKATSYVLNEYVAVPGSNQALSLWNLREPAATAYAYEIADGAGTTVFSDHTHSRNWFLPGTTAGRWANVLDDIQPDRHFGNPSNPSRNSGTSNFLYADGHVAGVTAGQVWAWVDQPFDFSIPR